MDEALKSSVQRDAVVGTRAVEALTGGGLFAFGLLVVVDSVRIGRGWAPDGPEAGFYPFYVGLALCAASGSIVARNLRQGAGPAFVGRLEFRRVLSVFLPAVGYVAGMFWLGMYVTSVLFLVGFMRRLGGYSWRKALGLGLGIMGALFALFELWFNVPLPKGPLEAWLGY